jgi:deazaflavin-dependent oxidoreductase (nitroreductase family)
MSQGRTPVLLLTTLGRKTGRPRTQAVGYVRDGPAFLVVASNGGLPSSPGWFFNLRGRPDAKVELDGARMNVRATILTGDERARAWRQVTTRHGFFNDYQNAVTRTIPVVRLEVVARSREG